MSHFLFFAHDPGGAMMLSAVAPNALSRGHQISFAAAGPAVDLWRTAGHHVVDEEQAGPVDLSAVDGVVTGTGFSDHERDMWRRARAAGRPTLAVIDAWTNLSLRFEAGDGPILPDAVGVLDDASAAELANVPWWQCETFVIGQPHLLVQTGKLTAERQSRKGPGGPLVFFSEPVREDYGDSRGFDQFGVFSALVAAANDFDGRDVLIKPHPREDAELWREQAGGRIALTTASAPELLVEAEGVLGMTTMVLVEAHLLGLPVLSLQPARTANANPLIDEIGAPVLDWAEFAAAWSGFVANLGTAQPVKPRFADLLQAADRRTVDAMEALVRPPLRE